MVSSVIIRYIFNELGILYEIPDLYSMVLQALCRIPRGKITTYRDISKALGDTIAARAIGYIMKTNPCPDRYPCYKVISSDGSLKGYSLGSERKSMLLQKEGIKVMGQKIIDFEKHLVDISDLRLPPVLLSMRRLQEFISDRVSLITERKNIRFVVTFDLSFVDGPLDIGIGVGCAFDVDNEELLGVGISFVPVFMPYIPTYLAFRELPAILGSLSAVIEYIPRIDAIILDGQGILHPRGLGIASHAGVITNIPSIGVAKSILVGRISGKWTYRGDLKYAPVVYNNKVLGFLVIKNKHKIVVSPGHKFSVDDARDFVLSLEWPRNEAEPRIIRLPHKIASRIKEFVKKYPKLLESRSKGQKSLDDFFL